MSAQVSKSQQVSFGMVQLGLAFAEILIRLHLLIFYTDRVKLDPAYAAIAIALGVIWDALNDPFIGRLSDRLRSSKGSGLLLMLIGVVVLSFGIFFLFSPPLFESTMAKFIFLTLVYITTNTGMSLLAIPYAGEGGHLFKGKKQASAAFGWRLIFGNLGTVIASLALAMFLGKAFFNDFVVTDYGSVAAVCSILIPIFSLPFLLQLKRRSRGFVADHASSHQPQKLNHFLKGFALVFRDKEFFTLFIAFVVATIGQSINAALAIYFYKYRLALSDSETQGIIAVFLIVFTLSVVGWVQISRKYDKKKILAFATILLGVLTCISYPFMPQQSIIGPMVMAVLGGILVGSILLFDLIVVELATPKEGVKTEDKGVFGLYFGFMKMGEKFSRAVSISAVGFFLELIGFQGNSATAGQATLIGEVFGFVVGGFFIGGALILLFLSKKPESIIINSGFREDLTNESA